jgi:hypothetical protein
MSDNTEALKPCPFCGCAAKMISGGPGNYFVQCTSCRAGTDDVHRDHAVELWNTRAALSVEGKQPVAVKALEWKNLDNGTAWASSIFGLTYQAAQDGWRHRNGVYTPATGLEAAKAAAQADFDWRVRSCLAAPPSLEALKAEARREALEKAAKVAKLAAEEGANPWLIEQNILSLIPSEKEPKP